MYEKAYNRSESCTSQEDKLGSMDGMTGENIDGMRIEGMTELPVENVNQQVYIYISLLFMPPFCNKLKLKTFPDFSVLIDGFL